MKKFTVTLSLMLIASLAALAGKGQLEFKDPSGDDKGPGEYLYPTDGVYTAGSFDLRKLKVKYNDKKVDFQVDLGASLDDPWGMGGGFAIQMIFIYINTGDGGHADGMPGTNAGFASGHEWNKVVILSPQKKSRVTSEVKEKAAKWKEDIVVPSRTTGSGKSIKGSVKLDELGGGDPSTWGYQVVIQSNEGFPAETDLLTRKVNEFEGQHRFGGGSDYDCDPHVIDLLAGDADGSDDEKDAQYKMLAYECDDDGESAKAVKLTMVRK